MPPGIRRHRLILVVTGLLVIAIVLIFYLLRTTLLPFFLGSILAFILHPVVKLLERRMPWRKRWPAVSRTSSILIIYVVFLAAVGGSLALIIPPASREAQNFLAAVPELYSQVKAALEAGNQKFINAFPEELRQNFQASLENAGNFLIERAQASLLKLVTAITSAFSVIVGLAIVPVFLYYLLKDRKLLFEGLSSSFPAAIRPHARNILIIVNHVLGAYVRAQLLVGLVAGIFIFLGLFFLGIRFAVLLSIISGIAEMVPVIGPWSAGIVGILITLITSPEKAIWVGLLYFGVRMLEDALLVPRIQGYVLKIHPIGIMVIIVVGSKLAGLWGVILGPPLVATVIEVVKYFYQEWYRELPPPGAEHPIEEQPPTQGIESRSNTS